MKMLSIGHNWLIISQICQISQKINWLTQISCIALMDIKRTVLIPTYQEKKVWLNQTFASRVIVVIRFLHTEKLIEFKTK